jgi:phosphatidylglycerol:prolipoprotein diacylglycerol transferase
VSTATIKFGPLSVHWFGVIIAIAIVVGLVVSIVMARFRGKRPEPLAGILMLGLLAGLIGGRVWYFIFRRDWYSPDPGRVFAVWQGGLALHGALLGGLVALLVYSWNKELDFWTWADICAPGLILAQAIGRLGDLVNNQAFGPPTNSALAVIIPRENRPPQYANFMHFTPTAIYEGAWDLAIFAALVGLTLLQRWRPRYLPVGAIFLLYVILYAVGRIPLEGLRVDSLWVHNMRVAQLASGAMIVAGVAFYAVRLAPRPQPEPEAVPVAHGLVSDAYLIAATRGGQARQALLAQPNGTGAAITDNLNGNGHAASVAALPPGGVTAMQDAVHSGAGRSPQAHEAVLSDGVTVPQGPEAISSDEVTARQDAAQPPVEEAL